MRDVDCGMDDVMRRIKQGSEEALHQLMVHGTHVLERLARRLLHDKGLAADVVQETFIAIWTRRQAYDEAMPAWPWIARILRNRCHEAWRRAGGRRRQGSLQDQALFDFAGLVPCTGPLLDEQHERAQMMKLARECIAELAPGLREVLQLHLFAELDERQIALALGIPLGTVKSRKNRGLSLLRSRLTDIDHNVLQRVLP